MNPAPSPIYRFGDIEVDTSRRCLRKAHQEQHLRQKTFQVLVYLLEQRDRLVTKDELIARVWKDTAVTDNVLVQCVMDIRTALDDDSRNPRFVRTIPKVGYRFIGPVEVQPAGRVVTTETEEATSIEFEIEEEIPNGALPRAIGEHFPALPPAVAPRRRWMLPLALGVCLIAAAALAIRLRQQINRSSKPIPEATLPQLPGKKALVVMRFENQSASADLDWLREGLAEMLVTDLSRAAKLTVLSRQQLHLLLTRRGHAESNPIQLEEALEMARQTRAEALVLGSFARLGEKIRLDVRLHDARTGQLLKAESLLVDRPEELLSQVDVLSLKLAADLGAGSPDAKMRSAAASVMTNNLEAYRYYTLALEKAQAYHGEEAIVLLKKAIALDPNFAMAYARIGYIHATIHVNEFEKAQPYLDKALQLSSGLTEKDKRYITAWRGYALNDLDTAIQSLREIIAADPQEIEAYLRLGYDLRQAQRLEEAVAVVRQGLAMDPESPDLYNALGLFFSAAGRFDEAIAAHQHYVALVPQEPNAHDSLGMSYLGAGRYAEAQAELDRALALNPDFHFAHLHLADVYALLGRYRAAEHQYRRYLQVAPSAWDRANGYHRLVFLYWRKGDLVPAERAAVQEIRNQNNFGGPLLIALARGDRRAAERRREEVYAPSSSFRGQEKERTFLRGYDALQNGRPDEAIQYLHAVAQSQPLDLYADTVADGLADAYLRLGRLDEAIAEYKRILKFNPNYPFARFHLAQAYERQGQRDPARAEYARFLEVWKDADPDIPILKEAKAEYAKLE
jgi:tetratricopeptide (TPR) repeat protein/DNA-binding winged helix-turn-helix (wHTH) protein